jgi:hypothetical protein
MTLTPAAPPRITIIGVAYCVPRKMTADARIAAAQSTALATAVLLSFFMTSSFCKAASAGVLRPDGAAASILSYRTDEDRRLRLAHVASLSYDKRVERAGSRRKWWMSARMTWPASPIPERSR